MSLRLASAAALAALACAAPAGASSAHCTPPKYAGFAIHSLHESGIGCDTAAAYVVHYLRNGHINHWSCSTDLRGTRGVLLTCFKTADHHQTLASGWTVN